MNSDVIGNGLFALSAAIIAIAYQYYQYRKDIKQSNDDRIAIEKKKIIEDLVSYRFVLTEDRRNDPAPTAKFNAALSAIPVHFSSNKDCIDKYRSLGNGFTAEQFYDLILALMKDVPLGTAAIDKALIENVPHVKPKNN
ncbi:MULTISPECIES: hypothetical protein [unclassified Chelatococcus]|uniref:hypothetical protein n=1 Tax=unclassified Chelatococcus TaxID=2638111 RepID=UPI001BCEF85C|nr:MULTISPECIES: hypothetical protein [unclassified Chelatococcus]MBS7698782.1 hypothetical protein [Chelatococcus sp. YT9]MBX3554636.1 hypothetical protein [Chelatococcus sp.]